MYNFYEQHKQLKQAARVNLLMFLKTHQEHYLDEAVNIFIKIVNKNKEFESNTGESSLFVLFNENQKEILENSKLKELDEMVKNDKKNNSYGKVIWKKSA